jgi:glycosyltransferase involved in cell wall biosynthesis
VVAGQAPTPILCSVVIVTYNRAHWLHRCVDSVRRSGMRGLEIVVVDSGSTDDTAEVARTLGPDVRYIYQPNFGVAAARNRGARECRGRYVGFLDSDDRWLPKDWQRLVELMDAHPEVAIGFGDALEGNRQDGYISMMEHRGREEFLRLPCRELAEDFRVLERAPFFKATAGKCPVFIGATLQRRDIFDRVGGFDEELMGADDRELWMRLALRCDFAYYDRVLCVWEGHGGNLSANLDHMERDRILAYTKILAKPLPLTAAERELVHARRRWHLVSWAYRAYDRGDITRARKRFALAMKAYGVRPRPLFYWCCCWLGPRTVRRLRELRWRIEAIGARSGKFGTVALSRPSWAYTVSPRLWRATRGPIGRSPG